MLFNLDFSTAAQLGISSCRSGNGWECAVGYVGEVLHTCSTDVWSLVFTTRWKWKWKMDEIGRTTKGFKIVTFVRFIYLNQTHMFGLLRVLSKSLIAVGFVRLPNFGMLRLCDKGDHHIPHHIPIPSSSHHHLIFPLNHQV